MDVAEHPSYKDMVVEAIQDIGDNASFNDIHKHLTTFYTLKNSPKFVCIVQSIEKSPPMEQEQTAQNSS